MMKHKYYFGQFRNEAIDWLVIRFDDELSNAEGYTKSCDEGFEVSFFGFSDIGFGLYFSGGQDFSLLSSSGFLDFSFELFLRFSLWISLG